MSSSPSGEKRVFVTGIGGFLGGHIARTLLANGYRVSGLIRGETPPEALANLPVTFHTGDLLEPDSYAAALQNCDVVVHAAALSAFKHSDPQRFYRVNHEGTRDLLQCVGKSDVSTFIHISSRGTLGVEKNPEESNEDSPGPRFEDLDDYMKSKALAEECVLEAARRSERRYVILSPTAMIGTRDVKPTPVGEILQSFLARKTKVYLDGGINVVDVEDVAKAVHRAILQGENGERYIIGNLNTKLYDLFVRLSAFRDVPLPRIKLPYLVTLAGAYVLQRVGPLLGMAADITPRKVYTFHHLSSYCSSEKSRRRLGLEYEPIDATLEKVANWFVPVRMLGGA